MAPTNKLIQLVYNVLHVSILHDLKETARFSLDIRMELITFQISTLCCCQIFWNQESDFDVSLIFFSITQGQIYSLYRSAWTFISLHFSRLGTGTQWLVILYRHIVRGFDQWHNSDNPVEAGLEPPTLHSATQGNQESK